MQDAMSKNEITNEIRKLNITERLNIITDIWDEIKESKPLEAVSDEEKRLLLNRLANFRAKPESASDWTDLKREAYGNYQQR